MSISLEALKEAVSIKEQIASFETRLAKILHGGGGDAADPFLTTQSVPLVKRGRKKMSAAARAKIGAAQKARWAKQKGIASVARPTKKKRRMSPEGRARIIAAQKKRWALKGK